MELNVVYHMDASELLSNIENESVDLILTDPSYGIGYKANHVNFSDQPRKMDRTYINGDKFDAEWIPEAYRILKENGAFYLCSHWKVLHLWVDACESAGFKVVQRIVWDKLHWGQGNLKYFAPQAEDILFCIKGEHQLRWEKRFGNVWGIGGQGNVWNENRAKYHISQKPIALMNRIIELSSDEGDLVVDPFMGSGTTCVAAKRLNRNFLGCDIDEKQVKNARTRLDQAYQLNLFS